MLDKIKEVEFSIFCEITDFMKIDTESYNDGTFISLKEYIVFNKKQNQYFTGLFKTTYISKNFSECKNIGEFLEYDTKAENLYFEGTTIGGFEYENIKLKHISFLMPLDENISLSNAMNNDTSQPQRAIGNYLQRELENSAFKNDPIEFYQNILDVANRELEMHKEGAYNI